MADDNLSVVLHKTNDLRLENTEIPRPGKGQVQLRMSHVGVCGTDIHFWRHGSIGKGLKVTSPFTLGHESSGVVNEVGEGVTNLSVGDRVTIEPVSTCKRCNKCKIGRYNLCPKMKICGIPPVDGGLRRYHVHDADMCYKLPDNVSLAEGALLEPLSVALHAARRAGVTLGSRVLVCGAGTVGQLSLLVSRAFGAAQVCITDLNESRLKIAKELGADVTLHVKAKDPQELASAIEQAMGGKPNVTLECSGAPSCLQSAIYATDSGGCVTIVGLGPDNVDIPIVEAALREVDIKGINAYTNCFPTAVAMMQSGMMNVQPLLTQVFKLEQSLEAFEMVAKGEGIKVMIDCTK